MTGQGIATPLRRYLSHLYELGRNPVFFFIGMDIIPTPLGSAAITEPAIPAQWSADATYSEQEANGISHERSCTQAHTTASQGGGDGKERTRHPGNR